MIVPPRKINSVVIILVAINFLLSCMLPIEGIAQANTQDQVVIDIDEIQNEVERVEIQRYTGYEKLFFRYLTLPYDISANTGNQGRYFDIGYILLALAPLGLLILTYREKRLFYLILLTSLLYLMLALSHSFVNVNKGQPVNRSADNWSQITSNSQTTFFQELLIGVYNVSYTLTVPIRSLANSASGQSDHITYPLISIFLILSLVLILKSRSKNKASKVLGLITISFFILWLILSAGIIWYGFLLLPLLFGFTIVALVNRQKNYTIYFKIILLSPLVLWIILAFGARISNLDNFTEEENLGKSIVDPKLIYYTAGMHSANDSQNLIYNNCGNTFEQINENDGLVYQIGTSMTFEIAKNTTRVLQDNILYSFFSFFKRDKKINFINEVLKTCGFKYIIIDLYTPTLDKTPEKSLTKKYTLFLETLYKTDNVKLLATDRVLELTSTNREVTRIYDLFGKEFNQDHDIKVIDFGSYAIYEIL